MSAPWRIFWLMRATRRTRSCSDLAAAQEVENEHVMDQGFTTGVTTPECGGLTPREVIKMIRAFVRQGVEAYVITECSSVYDPANKSARVATRLALDALGIRASPQGTGRV